MHRLCRRNLKNGTVSVVSLFSTSRWFHLGRAEKELWLVKTHSYGVSYDSVSRSTLLSH